MSKDEEQILFDVQSGAIDVSAFEGRVAELIAKAIAGGFMVTYSLSEIVYEIHRYKDKRRRSNGFKR